jgi:ABC-type nitrate/sulfonate/bicarbonate transport system ATPase subunit
MDKALLAAESLGTSFGALTVFEELSFSVEKGEFVTLLGPSGCGKSTILHVLSGLIAPDRGRVYLRGREITGRTGEVSYMQQKDVLLPWRRVIDNVALPLRIQGFSRRRARREAAPYFPQFGLQGFEYHYPAQLSGGMRQRAALLRTYLFSREVLLLDEPFARLDAITKRRLHRWFLQMVERLGSTVFFVTHDIEEALKLSDRIHILSARPARMLEEIDLRDSPRGSGEGARTDPQLERTILRLLESGERRDGAAQGGNKGGEAAEIL